MPGKKIGLILYVFKVLNKFWHLAQLNKQIIYIHKKEHCVPTPKLLAHMVCTGSPTPSSCTMQRRYYILLFHSTIYALLFFKIVWSEPKVRGRWPSWVSTIGVQSCILNCSKSCKARSIIPLPLEDQSDFGCNRNGSKLIRESCIFSKYKSKLESYNCQELSNKITRECGTKLRDKIAPTLKKSHVK